MQSNSGIARFFAGIDRWTVLIYVAIVCIGLVLITSASIEEGSGGFFSFSHVYMKQLMWMGVAFVAAIVVLLIEPGFYHKWAYAFYAAGLLLLLSTFVLGREVNGAKAWIDLGPIRLQPVELTKIATALALARVMSSGNFSIGRLGGLVKVALIVCLPMGIIVLQNDTGSALVFCSLLFVLYREGLNPWLCIPVILIAALAVISLLITPVALLILLILICVLSEVMVSGAWRSRLVFLAGLTLATLMLYYGAFLVRPGALSLYTTLLITSLVAAAGVTFYALRTSLRHLFVFLAIFLGSLFLTSQVDTIFTEKLQPHQKGRIETFLGLKDDPMGDGFNVNQSKIAIGSGGLFGKGFLQGTQIKYGFVPEQHTDFIFCTAGEEWGFVGSLVLLTLYAALILRLMRMGERQEEPFGRIYCYCVAAFLLFHLLVNVGMTIGLVPVMGIPLPLVSYGGSSLLAFTILIFIAIRFDASTRQFDFR